MQGKYPGIPWWNLSDIHAIRRFRTAVRHADAAWEANLKKHTTTKKDAIDKLRRKLILSKDKLPSVQERQDPPDDQDDQGPSSDRGVSGLFNLFFAQLTLIDPSIGGGEGSPGRFSGDRHSASGSGHSGQAGVNSSIHISLCN